jgi:hypothetical protein
MTSRLRSTFVVAAVGVLACVTTATAAPHASTPDYVGQFHDDKGAIAIRGSDGNNYRLSFELLTSSGEPKQGGSLTIDITCRGKHCPAAKEYSIPLSSYDATEPDTTMTTTNTFAATFGGSKLTVEWRHEFKPTSLAVGAGSYSDDGTGASLPVDSGPASMSATVFGLSCTGSGSITTWYGAGNLPAPGASLSKAPNQFTARHGHRPACAPS